MTLGIPPNVVMALLLARSALSQMDVPARQSFVVEMVEDRADLANAIALNSSMFNASRNAIAASMRALTSCRVTRSRSAMLCRSTASTRLRRSPFMSGIVSEDLRIA